MLPASLVSAVETHGCFSGCYSSESDVAVVTDPTGTLENMLHVSCEDCFSHFGVLAKHLPAGMMSYQLARELSEHMRQVRGYKWSVGGYHVSPASMWLSAAYYSCGIVLVTGERNRSGVTDLDCLIKGFQHGVITPEDPGMLQPGHYLTHEVYLDMSTPIAHVQSVQDILSAPQCSSKRKSSYHQVTVAEYLPFVRSNGTVASASSPAVASSHVSATGNTPTTASTLAAVNAPTRSPDTTRLPQRATRLGERCPVCGEVVQERPSLTKTCIGCLC